MAKPEELDGTQRAAILLMSLGEQDAANLLKQLDAKDVQRLGMAMAELKEVARDQMTSVLDKFIGIVDAKSDTASNSQDYVRRVLTQAVGKQKTDMLLDRVSTGQTGQGIEALKWMEAKAVAQSDQRRRGNRAEFSNHPPHEVLHLPFIELHDAPPVKTGRDRQVGIRALL